MTYLFTATFPYWTNIPEDVVVNTWHFDYALDPTPPDEGAWADINSHLATFYQAIYHNTSGLTHAPWLRPLLNTLRAYNLDDPLPRAPLYEAGMALTLGTPLTSALTAPETACCLSYQAAPLSGTPQARRRGRIFLGGLGPCIVAGTASAFPEFGVAQRNVVANAAEALLVNANADGWGWRVYSRVGESASVVTNGWVDDELDTQRRRGRRVEERTIWP